MNIEAIKLAREIMEAVPEELVDMDDWVCGSQACMLGHMALSGRFPGLHMTGVIPVHRLTDTRSYVAGARVLDISVADAVRLFDPVTGKERLNGSDKSIALSRLDALLAEGAHA